MAEDTSRKRNTLEESDEQQTQSQTKQIQSPNEESKTQNTVGQTGFWRYLHKLDVEFTNKWGVCAAKESKLGGLRPIMKALEISCHGVPWLVANVILFLCVHKEKDVELLVNLFFALLFDLVVVAVLKTTFRRSRPPANKMDMFATIPSIDTYSFPSGHSTRAAMLAIFFCKKYLAHWIAILCVVLWSVTVSISRLLLGRHHTSDIFFGYIIGVLEYVIYNQFWIPQNNCISWLELYFGHVHL